jgi:hypothetical protein
MSSGVTFDKAKLWMSSGKDIMREGEAWASTLQVSLSRTFANLESGKSHNLTKLILSCLLFINSSPNSANN